MEITKANFQAYEKVRASGATNMWDTQTVEKLSRLDRETIFEIMKRYTELTKIYPGVRKGR